MHEIRRERDETLKEKSDAMAWRELMRDTNPNMDEAVMSAWENWRERETWAGRAARSLNVDADV